MDALAQRSMFYREQRKIADGNEMFLEMVRDGLTREELAKCIARRPALWGRFAGFLDTLPSASSATPCTTKGD